MKTMGIEGELRHLEARNEVVHAYADHEKAKKLFKINDSDLVTLEDGLQKMVDWVKTAGSRKTPKFENIEITEKLPPIWLED
jgi:UDP-glucose 4-epimerase